MSYSLLQPESEAVSLVSRKSSTCIRYSLHNALTNVTLMLGLSLLWFTAGVAVGKHSWVVKPEVMTVGYKNVVFTYNRTFSSAPSDASDAAWEQLFPEGSGFIRQGPQSISAFSAFHQLHCLNSLRHAYYSTRDSSTRETAQTNSQTSEGSSEPHAMHCFDYLRQSVQCAADTTLERADLGLGGVSGWGTEHSCRDFDELRALAAQWAL